MSRFPRVDLQLAYDLLQFTFGGHSDELSISLRPGCLIFWTEPIQQRLANLKYGAYQQRVQFPPPATSGHSFVSTAVSLRSTALSVLIWSITYHCTNAISNAPTSAPPLTKLRALWT